MTFGLDLPRIATSFSRNLIVVIMKRWHCQTASIQGKTITPMPTIKSSTAGLYIFTFFIILIFIPLINELSLDQHKHMPSCLYTAYTYIGISLSMRRHDFMALVPAWILACRGVKTRLQANSDSYKPLSRKVIFTLSFSTQLFHSFIPLPQYFLGPNGKRKISYATLIRHFGN